MSSGSTEVAQKQGPRSRCYGRLGWHWARSNVRLGLDVSCRQRDWEQGLGAYRVTCCCPCGSSGHRKLASGSTAQGWAPLSGVPRGHNGHDASGPARACALLQAVSELLSATVALAAHNTPLRRMRVLTVGRDSYSPLLAARGDPARSSCSASISWTKANWLKGQKDERMKGPQAGPPCHTPTAQGLPAPACGLRGQISLL